MSQIKFLKGKMGVKAILSGEWRDSFRKALLDCGAVELELNDGKGWFGNNVDFLQNLEFLKSLIIRRLPLKSIDAIHQLTKLRHLELSTYADSPVDFSVFPNLEDCWFEWINGSESLFRCSKLKSLGVNRLNKKSSQPFSELKNLECLSILNAAIEELDGIFQLTHLRQLRLANLRRVKTLHGITHLTKLTELEIDNCLGISSITDVFTLKTLRRLHLLNIGTIDSIKGIEGLIQLESFVFDESTNIVDGDLSPLLKLARLKVIAFKNRRHYSHRREQFEANYYSSQNRPSA